MSADPRFLVYLAFTCQIALGAVAVARATRGDIDGAIVPAVAVVVLMVAIPAILWAI